MSLTQLKAEFLRRMQSYTETMTAGDPRSSLRARRRFLHVREVYFQARELAMR